MKIAAALFAVTALGQTASAYVVRLYTEPDCKGESREVNVYDNTCRNTYIGHDFRSLELLDNGGWRQRAHVYTVEACLWGLETESFWVDGGSTNIGDCKSFEDTMRSLASWHQA